jgi:cytoplasmic iron level regulating protein YaaA (DUF328/UPF0246 family)
MSPRQLLLVACSQRKSNQPGKCPAIERYDGVNYLILHKLQRQGQLPPTLDILILSAKYGLIQASTPIETYDLRMTFDRALEMQAQVSQTLDGVLSQHDYAAVFINLGKAYRVALDKSQQLTALGDRVTYAPGGIGVKMAAMRQWILSLQSAAPITK